MLGLFSRLLDLFWHESPEEHYARLCHEAEEKDKIMQKNNSKITSAYMP